MRERLGFKFRLRLRDDLADGRHDHAHGADGVVVRGDRIGHKVGIGIRVHERDDGNFQLARLGHGVVFALDVHDEHRGGHFVHRADAVEIFVQARFLAMDHRLLLLDVIVDRAVRVHLLNFLEPLEGGLDRVVIGQRAAEPAFGDIKLAAILRGFLDALLRLLFGADENDFAALANGRGEKIARGFELLDVFARSMMWMPLRASKMNGFILGFQRFV